jgi:citronellol/citronellal dehydrogenase
MRSLEGRTLFITGASRGIGLAIAVRAARDGANVAIVAKTTEPHPKLPGTIYTAAEAVEAAGGRALPLAVDLRDADAVGRAVETTAQHFGGIDVCVNNASAIFLAPSTLTPVKRFDLMHQVNTRGTFVASQACIPWLRASSNPHILMLSPPLTFEERWFAPHVGYSIAKYGMSLCVLGLAGELRGDGIGVNALWPRTTIATAAVENLLGGDALSRQSRTPEIVADAAWYVLTRPARTTTGQFFVDDDVLREEGITDLDGYAVDPTQPLAPDLFI